MRLFCLLLEMLRFVVILLNLSFKKKIESEIIRPDLKEFFSLKTLISYRDVVSATKNALSSYEIIH